MQPYWNPCLVRDPSSSHHPYPTYNFYVITLFADATIIPFTLSADAIITSWTPIKITSIPPVWKDFVVYSDFQSTLLRSLNTNIWDELWFVNMGYTNKIWLIDWPAVQDFLTWFYCREVLYWALSV